MCGTIMDRRVIKITKLYLLEHKFLFSGEASIIQLDGAGQNCENSNAKMIT